MAAGDGLDTGVVRAFWDAKSQEPSNRWTSADMLAWEIERLRSVAAGVTSVLDLGSGHGELSRAIVGDGTRLLAVDYAPAYSASFVGEHQRFVASDINDFDTDEHFDLALLFGVVTYIDEELEDRLYGCLAGWLSRAGQLIVKNQCAVGDPLVKTGFSADLGVDYSGRYPAVDEQRARLEAHFSHVTVEAYPEEFNRWADTKHIAFHCQ